MENLQATNLTGTKVWQKTSRSGIMPIVFEKLTFEKYFDHVIEYPILFAMRDGYIYKSMAKMRNLSPEIQKYKWKSKS